jgi:hypothetical protein
MRELRRGGFVIFIRRAAVLPGSSDSKGSGEWWKNCVATQQLAPLAQAQAKAIGHALPATLAHPALSTFAEGDTAIFRPEGDNKFHLVATLTPGQWRWIGLQSVSEFHIAAASPSLPAPRPVINPAKVLKGIALINALKKGATHLHAPWFGH